MMEFRAYAAVLVLGMCTQGVEAGIVFGPVKAQPGQSVRLVTQSQTPGGTIERRIDGRTSKGTISISRDRDLTWTFRDPLADGTRRGMVKVDRVSTTSSVTINGKDEKVDDQSPLVGKMFTMEKSPAGDWKFALDGSIPLERVKREIDELKVYLSRDWTPGRVVEVGDSWEFDPLWVKMVIEKDLEKAQTIGTMRLLRVRKTTRGDFAEIAVSIRSSGGDFRPDGTIAKANVDLQGKMVVDLTTMLDERLELSGKVVSSTDRVSLVEQVTLPVNLVVTKSFVRMTP